MIEDDHQNSPFGYHLASIIMSTGSRIELPERGIVVFVGPNNAGKSLALREIAGLIANPPQPHAPPKVVTAIEPIRTGSSDDLLAWLDHHAHRKEPSSGNPYVIYRRHGAQASAPDAENRWRQPEPHLHVLAPFFSHFLNAESRTGMVGSSACYDLLNEEPQNPLQALFTRRDLEQELAEAAYEAFGISVFVNRWVGSQIHLQICDLDHEPAHPASPEDLAWLKTCPHVAEQGDGIKSFLGIMLSVIAASYPIVVIDEPEAFLHPPQARLLGRRLASLVPSGTQILLATHSTDLLQGLLEAPEGNVMVIRITRKGDVNPTAVLDAERIARLWNDAALRYSNVLDGLFHQGVVLCEGDADATFYASTLDALLADEGSPASQWQFVQCGGKDRIHLVADALRAVNVPVCAVADFDVLRDKPTLKRIVDSLAGPWETFEAAQHLLATNLSSQAKSPSVHFVREQIGNVLDVLGGGQSLTAEASQQIKQVIKVESGWEAAKRTGLGGLSGDPYRAAKQLLDGLADIGLVVLPGGELERFYAPAAGLHGPAWLAEALRNDAHRGEAARTVLREVLASLDRAVERAGPNAGGAAA